MVAADCARSRRSRPCGPPLFILAVALYSLAAYGQSTIPVNTAWRPLGPANYGGKAYDLAVDPRDANVVYAAYGSWGEAHLVAGHRTWLGMSRS